MKEMLGITGRKVKRQDVEKMERFILNHPELEAATIQEIRDVYNSGAVVRG